MPQPGPVGQLGRLSETPVAFAGAGRTSIETVVAFVGAKWAFLVHFSVAVVLSVATVAVQGRAVVMVVSLGDRELTGSGTAVPRPMMAAVVHAVKS